MVRKSGMREVFAHFAQKQLYEKSDMGYNGRLIVSDKFRTGQRHESKSINKG